MITLHPEWKRLNENIGPLIEGGKTEFSYLELNAIAGIDIQTTKGRVQFVRFRKEALLKWSMWFENVRGQGYRVVRANEHVAAGSARLLRAHRQQKQALAIVTHTRHDRLTDHEKVETLAAQALIGTLLQATTDSVKKTRRIAGQIERPKLAGGNQDGTN